MIIIKMRKGNRFKYFDLKSLSLDINIYNHTITVKQEDCSLLFNTGEIDEAWLLSNNVVIDHIVPYNQKLDSKE